MWWCWYICSNSVINLQSPFSIKKMQKIISELCCAIWSMGTSKIMPYRYVPGTCQKIFFFYKKRVFYWVIWVLFWVLLVCLFWEKLEHLCLYPFYGKKYVQPFLMHTNLHLLFRKSKSYNEGRVKAKNGILVEMDEIHSKGLAFLKLLLFLLTNLHIGYFFSDYEQ